MVYKIGDTVQVVVTVTNNSAASATGTAVNIPLTELVGLSYISYTADQGTFDGTDWTVGTVTALDEVSITINMAVEDDCTEEFGPMTCEVTSDNDLISTNNIIIKTVSGGIPCCEINECVGDGLRPYLVYTALLTQEGTGAPVPIVLENTLGGDVVWSYEGTGEYMGTLSGVFTENKTAIIPAGTWLDEDSISISTEDGSGPADDMLSYSFFETRIYN